MNKDTIHKDINGDFYFLDLEKVKLYIWNHECNAYACVGIQRILAIREQLNHNESQDIGIKIFYKGIKIAERFFEQDANLIEYIDLKDTLDSNLLKLNRNGFSKDGDEKLEIVYQKVLYTVRKALYFFSKSELENKYIQKLQNIIANLLNDNDLIEDQDKQIQVEETLLSTAALVYFSSIQEWDEFFGVNKYTRTNAWNNMLEKVIEEVNKANKSGLIDTSKISTLFYFQAWDLSSSDKIEPQYISILDIINTNRKFAILSIREEKSHFWNEYIIEIHDSIHNKIKNKIVKLRKETKNSTRIHTMLKIDREVENIMKSTYNYEKVCNERKTMHIIRWLLNHIPTMAIFGSYDGNKRLNILDLDICDSIYFDFNMKRLTLIRMIEKYKNNHIFRFNTTVWSGYCYLGLEEKRNSILSVTRGKMSNIGGMEMIFPLTGEELSILSDIINRDFMDIGKTLKDYDEQYIIPFLNKVDNNKEIYNEYIDYIRVDMSESADSNCKISSVEMRNSLNPKIIEIIENAYKLSSQFIDMKNTVQDYEVLKDYKEKEAHKNMINYIMQHAKRSPQKEQIEILHENYLNEIIYTLKYTSLKKFYIYNIIERI